MNFDPKGRSPIYCIPQRDPIAAAEIAFRPWF